MSTRNNRYRFMIATPEDSCEILKILETEDFKGRISLLYTRRPDPYVSMKHEGKEVEIIICRNNNNGRMVGFGAFSINDCHVNSKVVRTAYIFGLRTSREYRHEVRILHKAYEFLGSILAERNVDYCLTTILKENLYARKMLEKRRAIMPWYEKAGSYSVYSIKPGQKPNPAREKYWFFRKARNSDVPAITRFLNTADEKYQFYPCVEDVDILKNKIPNLSYDDFYILQRKSDLEIIACGACWDQQDYKQYIVKGYNGCFRIIRPLSFMFSLFGYPSLPKVGKQLNFATLSFWHIRNSNPEVFQFFINKISNELGNYSFFNIGMNQEDPLAKYIRKIPHISYHSNIYLVNWQKEYEIKDELKGNLPVYLECGRL